jgi:hypothetical protein
MEGRGGWDVLIERARAACDDLDIPADVLPVRHINGRIL